MRCVEGGGGGPASWAWFRWGQGGASLLGLVQMGSGGPTSWAWFRWGRGQRALMARLHTWPSCTPHPLLTGHPAPQLPPTHPPTGLQVRRQAVQCLPSDSAAAGVPWDAWQMLRFGAHALGWMRECARAQPGQQLRWEYLANQRRLVVSVVEGTLAGRLSTLLPLSATTPTHEGDADNGVALEPGPLLADAEGAAC